MCYRALFVNQILSFSQLSTKRQDGKKYRLSEVYKFHALITTYELVLSDAEILRDIKWRLVVIDEAHRLKNQKCRLLNELKTLDLGTDVVMMSLLPRV